MKSAPESAQERGSTADAPLTLEFEGERRSFTSLPISIGRRSSNTLAIRDPRVSSAHALIEGSAEEGVTLSDLGSRNGTLIVRSQGQLLVSPNERVTLQEGDRVWLGDRREPIEFTVLTLDSEALTAAPPEARQTPEHLERQVSPLITDESLISEHTLIAARSLSEQSDLNASLATLLCELAAIEEPHELIQRAVEGLFEELTSARGVGFYPLASPPHDEGPLSVTPEVWVSRAKGSPPPPSQSFAERALKRQEVISYLPEQHGESESVARLAGAIISPVMRAPVMSAPVMSAAQGAGVFYAQSFSAPFSEADTLWTSALSVYVSARLKSATRYLELKSSAEELVQNHERLVKAFDAQRPLMGESPSFIHALSMMKRVAPTEASVLLLGETGTGKELAARMIHDQSRRAAGPFHAINCGAISESLLLSELFGHVKGAFTGAERDREGALASASGGTIFLDEIGEISAGAQVSLLRVLQEGEFTPVGGSRVIKLNARVIAATHRDLQADRQEGRFREDLYYRLAIFPISIPPLRERVGDIPLLAKRFLERAARRYQSPARAWSFEALKALSSYAWPGNIRQLEHEVERAVILGLEERVLDVHHLGASRPTPRSSSSEGALEPSLGSPHHEPSLKGEPLNEQGLTSEALDVLLQNPSRARLASLSLEQLTALELPLKLLMGVFEERVIRARLSRCDENRTHAAQSLELSRQALQVKLARWRDEELETTDKDKT